MSDFERALAFDRGVFERSVERVQPWRRGSALLTPSLPRLWDLNHLTVDDPAPTSAAELVAEAEPVHAAAGLHHRQLRVDREPQGAALVSDFAGMGWLVQRHCVMVHRREPDRGAARAAREVTRAEMLPAQEEYLASEPFLAGEAEVIRQILAQAPRVEAAVHVRYFGAPAAGPVRAYAKLYSADGVAQVEDVATVPAARGRGLARAAVLAAVEASRTEGDGLTFLVADDEDWPKQFYARLGFDRVGLIHKFIRRAAAR
jgi:ribosomal protein S18 acetylase RimI-like enzyme